MSEHLMADAAAAGTIDVRGDLTVNRMGFGAARGLAAAHGRRARRFGQTVRLTVVAD